VKQELLEDFEQKFVDVSETKITKMLGTCEQKLKQNSIGLDKVYDFFDALVKRGIPITFENKSKVLSISASAPELEGVPANRLYTAFCTYVSTKKPLGEKE
jgi:replicative DNA helicase